MENLSAEIIISGSALIVSVITIVIARKAVNRSNYLLIRLQLNTKHPFDQAVFEKMETILKIANLGMITTDAIDQLLNKLTLMVKSWVDFEWDCAKKEACWGKVKKKGKGIRE